MPEQNESLEILLSRVAQSQIADKNPKLMDHYVGIDVIEQNQTQSKVLAIAIFRVGQEQLFIPIIYLNGEVKPPELLFVASTKRFVPFTSEWTNYLLNKAEKELSFGKNVKREDYQRNFDSTSITNFSRFNTMPLFSKFSNPDNSTIYDMLKSADKTPIMALLTMLQSPEFIKEAQRYWDVGKVIKISKSMLAKFKKPPKKEDTSLHKTATSIYDIATAPAKVKDEYFKDGYAVIDKLKSPSVVHLDQKVFHNPQETGVYKAILADGKIAEIAILPYKTTEKLEKYIVFDTNSDKWTVQFKKDIWVFGTADLPKLESYIEKKLKPLKSIKLKEKSLKRNEAINDGQSAPAKDRYLVIEKKEGDNANYKCTLMFEIDDLVKNKGVITILGQETNSAGYHPGNDIEIVSSDKIKNNVIQGNSRELYSEPKSMYDLGEYKGTSSNYDMPTTFFINQDTSIVPLKVGEQGTANHRLFLGNEAVYLNKLLNEGYKSVDVYSDGVDFSVNVNDNFSGLMGKKAALEFFIDNLYLSSVDSYNILNESHNKSRKHVRFFVKNAIGNFPATGPYADREMYNDTATFGRPMPTVSSLPREEVMNVGQPAYRFDSPTKEQMKALVHQDIDYATRAAQTGSQEIFDYSVIGSLAKYSDIAEKISEYLRILESALDKIGQILFIFWWKGGKLIDKFGAHELKDLEDLLKNVFKNFGDLLLKLKNKQALLTQSQFIE